MQKPDIQIYRKIGAILFLLWGILHLWVPYNGFSEYYKKGTGLHMMIGGETVGMNDLKLPKDDKTMLVINNLFLNFVTNIGSSGILAIIIAYMLWKGINSWIAYLIGVICIGIVDLAFVWFMDLSGIIKQSFPVIVGPLLWVLAVIITPIGGL